MLQKNTNSSFSRGWLDCYCRNLRSDNRRL